MREPRFHRIPGKVVLVGDTPTGDSIRFVPRDPRDLERLHRSELLRFGTNGSVQLRLEGLAAPELHYDGVRQPLALAARDTLLSWLGFTRVGYAADGTKCTLSEPSGPEVSILSAASDARGRPISYLFHAKDLAQARFPTLAPARRLHGLLITHSANYALLAYGAAYFAASTSTPARQRGYLREAAVNARTERRGVWAEDATSRGFLLRTVSSIDTHGSLVFPPLFRRSVDYLRACARGFCGPLTEWLRAVDGWDVVEHFGARVPLHALVESNGDDVRLLADTLDLGFIDNDTRPQHRSTRRKELQ